MQYSNVSLPHWAQLHFSVTPGLTCHLLMTFSQIQQFLGSLGCPVGFRANLSTLSDSSLTEVENI